MTGRLSARLLLALFSCVVLVACGPSDGDQGQRGGEGSQQFNIGSSQPSPETEATTDAVAVPDSFTNDNWELVTQDADRYQGVSVTLTGEVFNVLDDSDGYRRFQIYTDPAAKRGNTHVAIKGGPVVKKGYQVRVVGTLQGIRTATAVSGRELRIPEVEAELVEVTGPLSVVTPTATPTPTKQPTVTPTRATTPTPTSSPTAKPATATPTVGRRSTAEPETTGAPAVSTETAAPPTDTSAAATDTPAPPAATDTPAPPTDTPTPEHTPQPTAEPTPEHTAEPTPEPAAPPAPATVEDPMPISIEADSLQLNGPIVAGQDAGASVGYIETSESDQSWDGYGNPPPTGEATVKVVVPNDGTYAIWSRMWYGNVDANSYWLIVDEQQAIKVGNDDGDYEIWRWVGWRDGDQSNKVTVELSAGEHTLRLVGREAGTRVDKLLITEDLNHTPE